MAKKNFIAKHNEKVAKNMINFAKKHPQLTGVSCTVGSLSVVFNLVYKPIARYRAIKKLTEGCNEVINNLVNELDDDDNTTDAQ